MNTTLHVVQACALAALIGGVVAVLVWLARAATPELLNRWGPTLATLGLRLREKLTRRRK